MSLAPDVHPLRVKRFLLVFGALVLLGSCEPDPLSGRIILSGSATLAPLVTARAEAWGRQHRGVDVRIEAIGTDAGFAKLVQYNETDLALMSRPMGEADRAAAAAGGLDLLVLPVAWDAVSLVVPASNTWALNLTREQALRAFTTAQRWSDLDPTWPEQPLHRFVLGPRSGTADLFAQTLLQGDRAALYGGSQVQSSEDDQILARGLAQVEGSLGFLGWTTVQESAPKLRAVALDGVLPTAETIRNRTYGLPRELWLVLDRVTWARRPEVRSLVRSLYESYPAVLEGTGLVPLEAEEWGRVETLLKSDR